METGLTIEPPTRDILDSPAAGPRVIRGTATRTVGYFAGIGLGLLAVPVLTRHLGVADYGSYVVVGSLVVIAMIFADAGLTAVGLREYAVRDERGRSGLMRSLLAARIASAAVAAVGVVGFALVAGYDALIVIGTGCGALGLVLTMIQQTYMIPLTAELRFGLAAALDLLRQTLLVSGILVLVAVGSGLLGFFVLPIPVALILLIVSIAVVDQPSRAGPPASTRSEWRYLLGEAVPAATATVLVLLFYRVAIVMMSLIASAEETGYFGLSFRVIEVLIAVPSLIVASALPVLARAAENDQERLAAAFHQLFDVLLILGTGTALLLALAAEPVIALLGGDRFAPAADVLRIQGAALAFTFLVALFGSMLWVLRAKRQLVANNVIGVLLAIGLTVVLVPTAEAIGAAVAMLIAEGGLVLGLGLALMRHRRELRPPLRIVAKVLGASTVAASVTLLPMPPLIAVILGAALYFSVLLALRALPHGLWRATFGALRPS